MNIAIVLNYKNYSQTIECAQILIEAGMDRIIIVDNASPNNSYLFLKKNFNRSRQVFVVESEKNGGYAEGNNFGLVFAEKKWGVSEENVVFIVNPDVVVNRRSIDSISNFILENKKAAIVSSALNGTVDNAWHHMTPISSFVYNFWILKWFLLKLGMREGGHYTLNKNKAYRRVDVVLGAFFGVKQDLFKNIGYFDKGTFLYYEEEILYAKMAKVGRQSYILTDSNYKHIGRGSTSLKKVSFKKINDASRLYVLTKYYHVGKAYQIITKFVNNFDNSVLRILNR